MNEKEKLQKQQEEIARRLAQLNEKEVDDVCEKIRGLNVSKAGYDKLQAALRTIAPKNASEERERAWTDIGKSVIAAAAHLRALRRHMRIHELSQAGKTPQQISASFGQSKSGNPMVTLRSVTGVLGHTDLRQLKKQISELSRH
jgi:hypothetical protein